MRSSGDLGMRWTYASHEDVIHGHCKGQISLLLAAYNMQEAML
jgi:hypothetical protein